MKKIFILLSAILLLSFDSYPVKVDGKYWDWENIPLYHKASPTVMKRDRAGLDIESVRMALGKKHLYMLIEGKSITGLKSDKGEGFKKTSIRISFSSTFSPLNRVRFLIEPEVPYEIKLSIPNYDTKPFGSARDRYWASGRFGKKCFIEIKMPVFYSSKGLHIGSKVGPIIRPEDPAFSRNSLCDVQINSVDMHTSRLVDTMKFTIKKGDI